MAKHRRHVREYADITRAPENIPPTPIPAIALPTIKAALEGALPHIKEPSSKTLIAVRKVPLIYLKITQMSAEFPVERMAQRTLNVL
jgi:hypothetical protein